MWLESLIIGALVLLAGFIDSIAGGGGLITLPAVSVLVGEGVAAVATNKILAVTSALTALIVYWYHGHVRLKRSLIFVVSVGLASIVGAKAGSYLTPEIFRWLVAIVFPAMLILILKRDTLTKERDSSREISTVLLIAIGIFCGFYDGCFGPGGGTLMFLSLAVVARMPMLEALASSKLANTLSAVGSLTTYAIAGHVVWDKGLWLAGVIIIGSLVGSRLASQKTQAVIKPVLVLVVALLIIKIVYM
jgi:uncharacterized protein